MDNSFGDFVFGILVGAALVTFFIIAIVAIENPAQVKSVEIETKINEEPSYYLQLDTGLASTVKVTKEQCEAFLINGETK